MLLVHVIIAYKKFFVILAPEKDSRSENWIALSYENFITKIEKNWK